MYLVIYPGFENKRIHILLKKYLAFCIFSVKTLAQFSLYICRTKKSSITFLCVDSKIKRYIIIYIIVYYFHFSCAQNILVPSQFAVNSKMSLFLNYRSILLIL